MGNDLFAKVIALSGLSAIFAEKALARALAKVGIDPEKLTPHDLRRALPEIERVLATFLDRSELAERMRDMHRLAT
jgi:integrase